MQNEQSILDADLSPEQQQKVIEVWNSSKDLDLQVIGEKVFGPTFKLRNPIGKKLKKFIASRQLKSAPEPEKLELTESQRTLIVQNITRLPQTLDLAQFIFSEKKIDESSQEFKLVKNYVRGLKNNEPSAIRDVEGGYNPPKKPKEAVSIVNKATFGSINDDKIEKDANLKTCLTALVRFLNSFRFGLIYAAYHSAIEKELFETTFVKYAWDKPDLTEEEVDQYINLSCDIVNSYNLRKELEYVSGLRDAVAEDSDGKKISMSLVESMANIRKELDDNLKRQDRSISALQGKRSQRIEMKVRENASVLQLVAAWRRSEGRARMLKFANERNKLVKKEIEMLDTVDAFKAEIWGLNPESFDYEPTPSSVVVGDE